MNRGLRKRLDRLEEALERKRRPRDPWDDLPPEEALRRRRLMAEELELGGWLYPDDPQAQEQARIGREFREAHGWPAPVFREEDRDDD
jgi:hypothetical protein